VIKLISKYKSFLSTTRANDWRYSFIPQIFGNLYLWIVLLNINFSFFSTRLLALSLTTSFGFAALGYFINEFFDKVDDAKSGKRNNLALLNCEAQLIIFLIIILATFTPWIWIPWNVFSVALIVLQIILFLLYSAPPIRLKKYPVISGIVDSGYAYVVPMTLSFYSFSLFAGEFYHLVFIAVYGFLLVIVGFRNITIHHINDIFKDKRIGLITLPRIMGVSKTNLLIKMLLILEFLILSFVIILLVDIKFVFIALFFPLFYILFKGITGYLKLEDGLIVNNEIRHATDSFYQMWIPLIALMVIVYIDVRWIFLVPIHTFLFFSKVDFIQIYDKIMHVWYDYIRVVLSFIINYFIYCIFLIFWVDLKKENKSALQYLKFRFGKNKLKQEAKDHDNS
jgi:4-hydroxybenzoate polyprenyltransferase